MELKRFLRKSGCQYSYSRRRQCFCLGRGTIWITRGNGGGALVEEGWKQKRKGWREIKKESPNPSEKRLLQAIDEDSKSFDAVIKAFCLHRNSEKERLHRVKEIQKAYKNATLTPQLVCERSIQLLEYSKTLILKGNPNAISDAGVAAFLADAALAGGLLNIGINLVAVTEKNFAKKMNFLMRKWARKRNDLMKTIS